MQKTVTPIFLTVVAVLTVAHARGNLITNGSFENTVPPIPSGGFNSFLPGSTGITGWTVVGGSGTEVSVVNTLFSQECCTFPAEDGSNWLDLTGDGTNNDTEGVTQTVPTTVGDQYTLSFDVGNVFDPNGIFGITSTADVSENGISLGAFENSCTTCSAQLQWQPFSTMFVASSSSTTLQFLNGDPANDNSNGLDNVSLVDNGPATVPEPSSLTLTLLTVGLLSLAGYARRRTARRAAAVSGR